MGDCAVLGQPWRGQSGPREAASPCDLSQPYLDFRATSPLLQRVSPVPCSLVLVLKHHHQIAVMTGKKHPV